MLPPLLLGRGLLLHRPPATGLAEVAEQKQALEGLSASRGWREEEEEEEGEVWTEEDLKREEEGVKEMEAKKRELQARLRAMEKDLGGLMRM